MFQQKSQNVRLSSFVVHFSEQISQCRGIPARSSINHGSSLIQLTLAWSRVETGETNSTNLSQMEACRRCPTCTAAILNSCFTSRLSRKPIRPCSLTLIVTTVASKRIVLVLWRAVFSNIDHSICTVMVDISKDGHRAGSPKTAALIVSQVRSQKCNMIPGKIFLSKTVYCVLWGLLSSCGRVAQAEEGKNDEELHLRSMVFEHSEIDR